MTEHAKWQWQQEGTSWKGIGIYHVTLTVPTREALLGTLVIPNNDPAEARVEQTELGRALLACQRSVPIFHPEIQILQYCLMPDHLHSIWYVRSPMKESIRYVAQGFWRAAKKAGRAYSYINACLTGRPMNEREGLPMNERDGLPMNEGDGLPMNEGDGLPMNERDGLPMNERALIGLLFRPLLRLTAVGTRSANFWMATPTAIFPPSSPRFHLFAHCREKASCKP